MQTMNPKVDQYLLDGCGRCDLWKTPACKVHTWRDGMRQVRQILLDTELTEEHKWGVACYTINDKNVLILSAFKDSFTISFFKGALLNDPDGILEKPGKNSQAARLIRFMTNDKIADMESVIRAYVANAIKIEKAGLQVELKKNPEPIPDELQDHFDADPAFQTAFEALTPGRQRGYILHFSGAKQATTRTSRIKKAMPKIFEGKGFHDR